MDVLKAIYERRATRHFSDAEVPKAVVIELIRAAVQAPSALNLQPWAFVILHGRDRLAKYSDQAKAHMLLNTDPSFGQDPRVDEYASPHVNIFHGGDTLIVVCAKPGRFAPIEECFLAAQNLMLAAHGIGLGSCPVGFARSWFDEPEVKAQLGIPSLLTPVVPIVIGYAAQRPPAVPKRDAEIVCWKWDD